jgi:hypothetical protein
MKHAPLVEAVLGPKYEDAAELKVTDWDGPVQLACTCGWIESRIQSSTNSLPRRGGITSWLKCST